MDKKSRADSSLHSTGNCGGLLPSIVQLGCEHAVGLFTGVGEFLSAGVTGISSILPLDEVPTCAFSWLVSQWMVSLAFRAVDMNFISDVGPNLDGFAGSLLRSFHSFLRSVPTTKD